jgi:light-regulated signal transduction histidine kinase (bacteriophytochrome)
MQQLIGDLLRLSRYTQMEMNRSEVDLSAMAAAIIADLRQADPQRGVRVTIEPNLRAFGDARLLRVVLDNLLRNAWKFTRHTPEPCIEFTACTGEAGQRIYCVRDNGAGFDMASVHKLFGAFQRLHRADQYEGTGIGLATAQRIIHRHAGRIWAEAEPGKGARFWFTVG